MTAQHTLKLEFVTEKEITLDYVVRAVNCHEELVEACKIALKLIAKAEAEEIYKKCVNPLCGERGYKFIEQSLAKAEGKE